MMAGFGGPSRDTSNAGIYTGTVTRLDGATAYVEVPHLAGGFEYPARYSVDHPPDVGDTVAAGFADGGRDELVILIRLA